MIRTMLTSVALVAAATSTHAATVTLAIPADPVPVTPGTSPGTAEGTFAGTGFAYSATVNGLSLGEDEAFLQRLETTVDPVPSVVSLTISRTNGQAFDLTSLTIPQAFTEAVAELSGTDGATGETVSQTLDYLYPGIALVGTTSGGATVEGSFLPEVPADAVDLVGYGGLIFGAEAFGPGFEGLVSLTLNAVRPQFPGTDELCLPVNARNIDPRFLASGVCSDGSPSEDAPLQNVDLFVDAQFMDTPVSATLTAITVETADVAPIPVPASLPLLLGGVGALALGARRTAARRKG